MDGARSVVDASDLVHPGRNLPERVKPLRMVGHGVLMGLQERRERLLCRSLEIVAGI